MKEEKERKQSKNVPEQLSFFSSDESEAASEEKDLSEPNFVQEVAQEEREEPQNAQAEQFLQEEQEPSGSSRKKILKKTENFQRMQLRFGIDTLLKFGRNPKKFFARIKNQVRYSQEMRAKELTNLSVEQKKIIEERVQENATEVAEFKKNKHKTLKNCLYLIFNIALVVAILLWNVLTTDDYEPLGNVGLKFEFLLVALALLAFVLFMDACSVHRMIFRKTLRSRWFLSFKATATLRYYDAITPLSSGGQAFMVGYLTKHDVPGSTALSIPISKLLFQNISWLLVTGICLILSLSMNVGSGFVSAASWIGFLLCFILVLFIIFVSKSKTVGKKILPFCLRLLCKMKIIKNYDKAYQKSLGFVEDYQTVMKEYSRSKIDSVLQLLFHVCRTVAIFSIPFFIYCAFMGWAPEKFGEFFMYTALIDLASSFIPLPGGTGMNEITFTMLFKQYLGGYTFWALLFWRFCSYYYYLIQGLFVQGYDAVYGNKKWLWTKKKLELQEESRNFKREQIENFRKERIRRRKNERS